MSTRYIAHKHAVALSKDILTFVHKAGSQTMEQILNKLENAHQKEHVRKRIYRLKEQKSLAGSASSGYLLTSKGMQRLEKLTFQPLKQIDKWDKKWRLVAYDIPESQRIARDHVRRLIKELGFRKIQQSIWAHPLPCLEPFNKISNTYGLNSRILLIEAPHTNDFNALLEGFREQYPAL